MAVAAAAPGRAAARGRRDRRRRAERRHGLRGAQPRRQPAGRPAGDAQRQRHVDLGERRRAVQLLRARALGPLLRAPARGRQERAAPDAARARARAPLRGAHEGHVLPGTLFEEMGFNYIGPIDGHDVQALVRTLRNLRDLHGPAVPARGHAQGQGLRAGRGRPDHLARAGPLRSGAAARIFKEKTIGPDLFAGVRRVAVRHGRARPAHRRASRRRCARARAWSNSRSAFRSATSTSPSPSSTPSPSPPASPARACGRWSRSTRPSCSAATTS